MAPTTPTSHDPALSHAAPAAAPAQPAQPAGAIPPQVPTAEIPIHLAGLDQNQIMNLLRSLPNVFSKLTEGQNPKEDAAQVLSNLAQAPAPFPGQHLPVHYPPPGQGGMPGVNDPGPSSHPRGPPNLGQLTAVALQAAPVPVQPPPPRPEDQQAEQGVSQSPQGSPAPGPGPTGSTSSGGRRGGRNPAIGTDEWTRQRKDNHKEVERRRRGNINEGINELGRIVPNGSGEKAKGAILARAVQYIHHLKENEARNIEKWTLEKLLMDQAMGDLQAQLEEVKRMWDEERIARARLEADLEILKNGMANNNANANASKEDTVAGNKRRSAELETPAEGATSGETGERDGKRARTE